MCNYSLCVAFGRFFQIRDDFANICDPAYWKSKGFYEDADEGKKSYPVTLFLEDSDVSEADKNMLREILSSSERTEVKNKLKAYKLLYNSGVLETTRQQCEEMQTNLANGICSTSKIIGMIMDKLSVSKVLPPAEVESLVL